MKKILSSDLWQSSEIGDPNKRRKKFLDTGAPAFQNLIDSLIIHDQVLIPTHDFLVITVLANILGEKNIRQLLESQAIKFLRIKGSLGYAGSGGVVHGLCSIKLGSEENPHPYSLPADEALHWAFTGIQESRESLFLKAEIMESLSEIELSDLLQTSMPQIHNDLKQKNIAEKFVFEDISKGLMPELKSESIRLYESPHLKSSFDDIDLIMHISHANIEITLTELFGCNSCSTESPIISILHAKEQALNSINKRQKFYSLSEIASIPNLGKGIIDKNINFDKILKIRFSKKASEFRRWFHDIDNKSNIEKEYIDLLKTESRIDSLEMRLIRFISTTGIGLFDPIAGIAAGILDNFFVPKVLGKNPIKFFVEKLSELGEK